MSEHHPRNEITTSIGTMWIEDGVLWHRLRVSESITQEHAESVIDAVARLTGGKAVPAVVDMRDIGFATAGARQKFAGGVDESLELATALVVRSMPSRLMAEAYLKLARPRRPVAVFYDPAEARLWAAGFVSQ